MVFTIFEAVISLQASWQSLVSSKKSFKEPPAKCELVGVSTRDEEEAEGDMQVGIRKDASVLCSQYSATSSPVPGDQHIKQVQRRGLGGCQSAEEQTGRSAHPGTNHTPRASLLGISRPPPVTQFLPWYSKGSLISQGTERSSRPMSFCRVSQFPAHWRFLHWI